MIEVQINERQLANLNRKLTNFASRISDTTTANRKASISLYAWTISNFDKGGGLAFFRRRAKGAGKWAPLAESTIKEKKRLGKTQMLVRSGVLRGGFISFYSRNNAGVANTVPYSKFHHEGTKRMPARQLLPDQDVAIQIGLKVYGGHVADATKAAR